MDALQGPPKWVRGHNRKQAIWDFEPDERLTVTFEAGQPVGKEAKELTSFLQTVAKMSQHIDISIKDWRKVSDEKKDYLWNEVRYKTMLEDGTVFEKKGYDGETPFNFITDEEQVIAGLDQAVATMKKGEQAITMGHEYGYGIEEAKCYLAVIP